MTSPAKIVVIGGGYAGGVAALRACRRLRGEAEVVLISEREGLVDRGRLHQAAAGTVDAPRRPLAELVRGTGVRIVHARAEGVDRDPREVLLEGGGRERSLRGEPERALDRADAAICVSLGRREGVVQLVRSDGAPRGVFFAGRLGARLEEMSARYPLASIEWERDGTWAFRCPRVWRRRALPSIPKEVA